MLSLSFSILFRSFLCLLYFTFYFFVAGRTLWVDVCQNNGNFLAAGGTDGTVKIFDKRGPDIIKTLEGCHSSNFLYLFNNLITITIFLGEIRCVRWNPSGDMLASASYNQIAKLWDLKTEKELYTGTSAYESKLLHSHFHN